MLFRNEPATAQIESFLEAQRGAKLSYPEVGATRTGAPPYYKVDHNRVRLGTGEEAFRIATGAMRQWKMFDLGWVRIAWPGSPIQEGTTVAVVARTLGFWSLNACRIVYTLDETDGPVRRFGFAYGTLSDHAESGEERFSIEHHRFDGSVWYDLFAFSRPRLWLAQMGYPVTRIYQKRFARDSKAVMVRSVADRT
ncbi:MAG TPA: DUF1990 domain-containing protein [Thermoanaerobaculia bacterium]|nr:DUF1990 domain-containing protein [Thermoanaerobaculia bacterium]